MYSIFCSDARASYASLHQCSLFPFSPLSCGPFLYFGSTAASLKWFFSRRCFSWFSLDSKNSEKNPHAELIPFVVEARGRLGSEVLSFLRQHAPEEEPLRSAVLARATREISIITQRGLAALLLSAEPRPAMV